MEPITTAATNAANTVTRALWGGNPSGGAQKVMPGPATGGAPATDESHSSRDTAADSPTSYTSEGGPPTPTDHNPNLPFSGSIEGVSSLGGKGTLKGNGTENTDSHVSLGETETRGFEGSSIGAYPDTHDHSLPWLGKTELGNYAPGDHRPDDTHPTGIGRSSDALGETELGKTQPGHTEVGHSSYTTDTANRTPSDFTFGTQSHREKEAITSGSAGVPRDSSLSGTPGSISTHKSTSSNEPTGQSGLPQPPTADARSNEPTGQFGLAQPSTSTPAADAPSRSVTGSSITGPSITGSSITGSSVTGSSEPGSGAAVGPSVVSPPSTEDPPAPKQQGADKPLSEPSGSSVPAPSGGNPAPSGGNPLMGGMKLNNETTGQGTGEKYEKSTGLAADGGDFDASRPGAGREAE